MPSVDRTASGPQTDVVVCGGPDCAKDCRKDFRALVSTLRDAGVDHRTSKCLGVCHGPVAVVRRPDTEPIVVRRIRKASARDGVVAVSEGAKPKRALTGKQLVDGKKAKRAVVRAGKAR